MGHQNRRHSKAKHGLSRQEKRIAAIDRNFQEFFRFDLMDLEANREGWITENQFINLMQIRHNTRLTLWFALPLCVLILNILPLYVFLSALNVQCLIEYICIFGAYWMTYIIPQQAHLKNLTRDIEEPSIRRVIGISELNEGRTYTSKKKLTVGNITFTIAPKFADYIWGGRRNTRLNLPPHFPTPFRHGVGYIIYYAPHSKTILSATIAWKADFDDLYTKSVITMGADGEIEVG